jgi:hypothetical protein
LIRTLLSIGAFVLAVGTFSRLWEAFRGAWQGQPTVPPGSMVAMLTVFLLSMTYLVFVTYAADRSAGKVKRRVALFERLLRRDG